MHPLKIRLCEEDRQKYGGDEWLPLHAGSFTEHRASFLRDIEKQAGLRIIDLLAGDVDPRAIEFSVKIAWFARQVNGFTQPAYADFDPLILKADLLELDEPSEGDDVDPPASSSAETSAEKAKSTRSRRGSKQ